MNKPKLTFIVTRTVAIEFFSRRLSPPLTLWVLKDAVLMQNCRHISISLSNRRRRQLVFCICPVAILPLYLRLLLGLFLISFIDFFLLSKSGIIQSGNHLLIGHSFAGFFPHSLIDKTLPAMTLYYISFLTSLNCCYRKAVLRIPFILIRILGSVSVNNDRENVNFFYTFFSITNIICSKKLFPLLFMSLLGALNEKVFFFFNMTLLGFQMILM